MRLIGVKALQDYKVGHANIVSRIDSWIQEVKEAKWATPHNLKAMYPTADFLKNNNVVINLKGNHYRILIQVDYQRSIVMVKGIGTHAEYDKGHLE